MKATGPLVSILIGSVIFILAWTSGFGPTDHNIGRSIANSVLRQGFMVLGGIVCAIGVLVFLTRWLGSPPKQ